MRAAARIAFVVVGSPWLAPSASGAPEPWEAAAEAREALSNAETELVLEGPAAAARYVEVAADARRACSRDGRGARGRSSRARAGRVGARARRRPRASPPPAPRCWTAIVRAAYLEATAAAARGDAAAARRWLLVREFRPPTRFSRAAADATLALDRLAEERSSPQRLRRPSATTCSTRTTAGCARRSTRCGPRRSPASTSAGPRPPRRPPATGRSCAPHIAAQRGPPARREADALFARLVREATAGALRRALAPGRARARGFRAAPLSDAEQLRRAGQLDRFLELVPIEYGRGVEDGRVVLDFEIQEAITFRDGAAAAFGDLEPILLRRDPAATRGLGRRSRRSATRSPPRRAATGRRRPRRSTRPRPRRPASCRDGLPGGLEGGRRDRRLRRDRGHARPGAGRRRAGRVGPGRAGAPRGVRRLRARPGAAAARARAERSSRGSRSSSGTATARSTGSSS